MAVRFPLRRSAEADVARLEQRVRDLEADMTELRRHNLRVGELADIVQELLIPMASRDEEVIRAAIKRFNESM